MVVVPCEGLDARLSVCVGGTEAGWCGPATVTAGATCAPTAAPTGTRESGCSSSTLPVR